LLEGCAGRGVVPLGPVETVEVAEVVVVVVVVAVVVVDGGVAGLELLFLSPQETASTATRARGARRRAVIVRPKGSGACIVCAR
jgi:hypothetical protein